MFIREIERSEKDLGKLPFSAFAQIFFFVLACFFNLGLELVAGHVQKSMEKNRKVWKRMGKY